ncbi:hypothetical protein BC749_103174 [Flavobacterium araucananum]|nr:hypothetical protein BC749_103174 [Flavobacterium araucananum]
MFFLFLASSCNTYIEDEQIYQLINIENWKAKGSVKVKLYHYEKDTNFKKIIAVDSLFEVTNDSKYHYLTIIPEFLNDKPINDDMILLLNDSLEYRFTKVSFLRDTLKLANPTGFLGRKIIVRYNLKATVNEKEINYKDTLKSERQSSYISLDASLGKRIK